MSLPGTAPFALLTYRAPTALKLGFAKQAPPRRDHQTRLYIQRLSLAALAAVLAALLAAFLAAFAAVLAESREGLASFATRGALRPGHELAPDGMKIYTTT